MHVQPEGIDSLEPQYPCPAADDVRAAYTTGDNGTDWQHHLNATAKLFAKLDAVSGIEKDDDAGWHTWFDHYYDNLSAKQCHGKSLPCSVNDTSVCVTQEEVGVLSVVGCGVCCRQQLLTSWLTLSTSWLTRNPSTGRHGVPPG